MITKTKLKILNLIFLAISVMMLASCVRSGPETGLPGISHDGEGVAIYLTRETVPLSQMDTLTEVNLVDTPVISATDIKSYDWNTHEMMLTESGWGKINAQEIPIGGRVFWVCVDKEPVYRGGFYNGLSSYYPPEVPVIYSLPDGPLGKDTISIRWDSMTGEGIMPAEDPRDNPKVYESLVKWEKIEK